MLSCCIIAKLGGLVTRLGQNLKIFPKNYYWWLPLERKSKNKGAKQRTHCCAQAVILSLKSNSRLVTTSTYRLLKSIFCTVGDYLTFHHLLTFFPSVQPAQVFPAAQSELVQSYQSILPSLPNWASACLPPVKPEGDLFRAVHSPLPPSKWFWTISQALVSQSFPQGLYLQRSCNPQWPHGRFVPGHGTTSQMYWVPVCCDS